MPRIHGEGSLGGEYRVEKGEAPIVPLEQVARENAREVHESGKEAARVAIKEYKLAKNAKTEEEMIYHLKEFNTVLVDILVPVRTKIRNEAHSRILKDNNRQDMNTLATLKWLVTGKEVPGLDTTFYFSTGSQGNRIVFKTETMDGEQKSEDGNIRWMVYHEPTAEDGRSAHEYWERFRDSFGIDFSKLEFCGCFWW